MVRTCLHLKLLLVARDIFRNLDKVLNLRLCAFLINLQVETKDKFLNAKEIKSWLASVDHRQWQTAAEAMFMESGVATTPKMGIRGNYSTQLDLL